MNTKIILNPRGVLFNRTSKNGVNVSMTESMIDANHSKPDKTVFNQLCSETMKTDKGNIGLENYFNGSKILKDKGYHFNPSNCINYYSPEVQGSKVYTTLEDGTKIIKKTVNNISTIVTQNSKTKKWCLTEVHTPELHIVNGQVESASRDVAKTIEKLPAKFKPQLEKMFHEYAALFTKIIK